MTIWAVQGSCWKRIVQHPDPQVDSIKRTETILVQMDKLDDPLATTDEKYKVQNFIDTVVFRGGDATSGWLYAFLSGGAGFAASTTAAVAMPMVLAWLWVAQRLGAGHRRHEAAIS